MIVKLIGWLVSRECIMAMLYRMAEEYEGGHLYDEEGAAYMGRWSLIAEGSKASRVLSFLTGGMYGHIRIHWIHQPDRDRELHDHPFNYRTFVMDGWYTECYIPVESGPLMNGPALRGWQGSGKRINDIGLGEYRLLTKGQSASAPLGQFHRIATVSDGGVWTLFCMGQRASKWGFLVDGRWVKHTDFFKLRGISHNGVALS